ncbi:MAG: phosphoglycerate dehydrogenase [Oligoflexia bacterium]|nr:phosphoglycerate dehydrogenase [Oligoflexia bacterium]
MQNIVSTPSSFGDASTKPVELLRARGFNLILNPLRRKLSETEVTELLKAHRPVGLLAGLEPLTRGVIADSSGYLKVISRVGVGIDNVDLQAASEFGVSVFKSADVVSAAVAEFTIGLMLSLLRGIPRFDQELHAGRWSKQLGRTLNGKTVALLGCGSIGRLVASMLRPFGVRIVASDPALDAAWAKSLSVESITDLQQLAAMADLLSIHLPLNSRTKGLVSRELLGRMKRGAYLINTSRGGIVDEEALCDLLKSGHLAGAAIDVFSEEPYKGALCELPNVVLTPHAATYTLETREALELSAVENLLNGLGIPA